MNRTLALRPARLALPDRSASRAARVLKSTEVADVLVRPFLQEQLLFEALGDHPATGQTTQRSLACTRNATSAFVEDRQRPQLRAENGFRADLQRRLGR